MCFKYNDFLLFSKISYYFEMIKKMAFFIRIFAEDDVSANDREISLFMYDK